MPPNKDSSWWYVETKLNPPVVRKDTIQRSHLIEALCRSINTFPLTLVSAPAGYGKTTLLAALPYALPDYPLAWITLETEDNDPVRFMGLLTTAFQRLHPDCGRSVLPLLAGGAVSGSDVKHAAGILVNDIMQYLKKPFILVLDDLHYVTEPMIYVALEYLFEQQPPNLHVAIATRYDPPLRLTRLAVRRQIGEIRRADLSLNQAEASQLLNDTLGLSLTDAEVAVLQERTEGWPGALCLVAGPLGRMDTPEDRDQFLSALSHTEQQAQEFMAEEILRYLPEDVRQFLMQTAILAEISPSTCRVVTRRDDAGQVLAELYHRNLAIALIKSDCEGEPVYRYHALFARLLTMQLERELSRKEIVELHRRAAEVQKTPGRALAHYFSARLWDQAAELMVRSGMELLHRGMAETVRQWYDVLPAETRNNYPYLTTIMARCEIHRGEYSAAAMLLEQARKAFLSKGDAEGEGVAVTSLITLCYQNNDRVSAAKLIQRAFKLPLDPMGQVASRLARAWLHMYNSKWDAARADIFEALAIPNATGDRLADLIGITYMTAPMAAMPGCLEATKRYCAEVESLAPPDTAWCLGALELGAWPLLWEGQKEEALIRVESAEALRQRLGGYPFVGNDLPVLLASLYLAEGETEGAGRAVETLVQRLEKAPRGKWNFYMHAAGRSLALLGRLAEAAAMQRRLERFDDDSLLTCYLRAHLKGLNSLLAGSEAEAAAALEKAARLEVQLPMAQVGGSARLLQARLLLEQGQPDTALSIACPILNEWNKASTLGYVILDGPALLPVLKLAADQEDANAARLLHFFPADFHTAAGCNAVSAQNKILRDLPEPLTPRECDVLKLLVIGCTNFQISTELHVSKETVKSHVAHILRKLDVHSRAQAAARARELGF